jgi:hypothetical protein
MGSQAKRGSRWLLGLVRFGIEEKNLQQKYPAAAFPCVMLTKLN